MSTKKCKVEVDRNVNYQAEIGSTFVTFKIKIALIILYMLSCIWYPEKYNQNNYYVPGTSAFLYFNYVAVRTIFIVLLAFQ